MFSSMLTIASAPSRERRRLTAPISTPSAVESRNVVSVRSTTIRIAAALDRLGEHLLELGGGEEVDLAAHGEDVALAVDRVLGDRELRWHRVPFCRSWSGPARRSRAG